MAFTHVFSTYKLCLLIFIFKNECRHHFHVVLVVVVVVVPPTHTLSVCLT